MAKLRGGPAGGLHVDDDRSAIWVAYRLNCYGKPVPLLDDRGFALTVPDEAGPPLEEALTRGNRRWECYRKVGAYTPEIHVEPGAELPYPPEGETAFHWVCRRR